MANRTVHNAVKVTHRDMSQGRRPLGFPSSQLAVLDREAGARLLERIGRNVRFTEAGRALVRHAATPLEVAEAEPAGIAAGHPAGVVRVSAFQSAFLCIVSPVVAALAQSSPDIRVEATELGPGKYRYLPVSCTTVIVPVFRSTSDHRRPLRSAAQLTELLSATTRLMVTARITAPKK